MKSKHFILAVAAGLACVAGLAGVAAPVRAETCTTQYGGTTTCVPADLTINKEVRNPATNIFVENLGVSDTLFVKDNEVLYKLTVKNTGSETLNPITVHDIFPPYLTFMSGPGTYDSDTRTLTFELDNVVAGESRSVEILAKVVELPSDKDVVCVVNHADAAAGGRYDEDTAQICLGANVLGATLPVAGFNDLTVIVPFLAVGLGGLVLLKRNAMR